MQAGEHKTQIKTEILFLLHYKQLNCTSMHHKAKKKEKNNPPSIRKKPQGNSHIAKKQEGRHIASHTHKYGCVHEV